MNSRVLALLVSIGALLTLAACGGGGMTIKTQSTFTIGGTVAGLTGTGLVLQNNGGDDLTVAASATSFTFATRITEGGAYSVTVSAQPSGMTCSVANGTGTASANVTNVTVTCASSSNTFTIGGTITGLTATGLVLQNNGGDNLTVASGAASFTFATPLAAGATYSVTVLTQPSGETCTVTANGTGTATANVTNVAVTCSTSAFTIGGTISGLTATGLVLQNNGADNLPPASGATSFTFATPVAAGSAYNVTVLTQPSGLTCTVTNGSGTANANVTNVAIACTNTVSTFTIGGTIVNLTAAGLVLQDNGGDNLSVAAGATSFTFATPVAAGSTYNVSVLSQPVGQVCSVGNATGTATADVTSVSVTCTVNALTISVAVSGLTGTGLVFQDNGVDNLSVAANGTFTFANGIAPGAPYNVTILTQPTGQTCSLGSNATGVATTNVIVNVACSMTLYSISVAVSGLTGTGLVFQDNGADNLTVTANGTFAFATSIASGGAYAVTIFAQPTGQTCTLGSNASGTATANVIVTVTCTAALYNINVAVTGLTGTGLVFQDNGADNLSVTTSGTFPFATQIANGQAYHVTVLTQPTGQTCTLGSNAAGTVNGADVTVTATCGTTTTYTITVTVTGLTGSLTVQDDQSETLTFTTNSSQTFPHLYAGGSTYAVTVTSQPSGQNCTLGSNASGTINANTTVTATCVTSVNSGEWTWINGQNIVAVGGSYPPTTPAEPGTRYGASTWTDTSGNFWLFGGIGYDINGPKANSTTGGSNESVLSDLWEFKSGAWNYKGGQALTGQCFDFPTSPGPGTPSARSDAVSWTDLSGNFFMFGGYEAYNATAFCPTADAFNDMWEYTAGAWTWVGGSSTQKQSGIYNGIGSTGTPGARYWSTGARDTNGNLWMFGGYAYDSTGALGYINDTWEWNGTTWTWVSGSKTQGQKGTYTGTSAVPGGRVGANSWIDSSGNVWIFGGIGYDSAGNVGEMNDLWSFDTSTSKWTFVGGSTTANPVGSYGTEGVADPSNVPPGRAWATSWITPSGDVYILGGQQFGGGLFNDLWKYSGGQWTWVAPDMPGDSNPFVNELGIYGTQGTANSANAPGGRDQGLGWTDASGNLWLFGGFGLGTIPVSSGANVHAGFDSLQDLWEFQP